VAATAWKLLTQRSTGPEGWKVIEVIIMETHECWWCEKEFEFNLDDVHESCDTVDGQYTVFEAINCPYCGIENRW